jgi:hypothetical protein
MFELLRLPRFATLAVLAALLGLGSGAARALYDVEPGEIPGRPGTLIRIWPLEGGGPGVRGGKADGAPVFIAQGTADTTVNPAITKRFGEAPCAQGVRVSFVELPGVTHTFAARDSANASLNWMNDRFRGEPAPSSCER